MDFQGRKGSWPRDDLFQHGNFWGHLGEKAMTAWYFRRLIRRYPLQLHFLGVSDSYPPWKLTWHWKKSPCLIRRYNTSSFMLSFPLRLFLGGYVRGGRLTSHYNLLYAKRMELLQEDWQRMSAEAQLESAQEVIKAKQRGREKQERICFFWFWNFHLEFGICFDVFFFWSNF